MNSGWNRHIYRALLLISFLGVNALILFGIGSIWFYLNSGADRSSMLHVSTEQQEAYLPKITWGHLEYEGRPMEKQTLKEIQKDYLNAWHVRNIAYKNNDPYGLKDYYTDSLRLRLNAIIDLNKQHKTVINQTTIAHHPQLEFYSADGKLAIFTDRNVITYQEIYTEHTLVLQQKDTTSYQVIMLLEDGFWRIRHLVEIQDSGQPEPIQENLQETLGQIAKIKGVNYYPKDYPWAMFGPSFADSIISADFKRIRKMGLNTVRIFVPYEDFGKAKVYPQKMERLITVLDVAEKHGLKIVVTLFDFYGNYDITDWTLTHRHAETIVTALKDHKALLAWDIKNEPDLDFETRGKQKVTAWLQEMNSNIKKWDQRHPVTIGWSSPEVASNLAEELDVVSFHYYKDVADFSNAYSKLKESVPDKPLLLQEYGYTSYSGLWNGFMGSEGKQAAYYKKMQTTLKQENIPYMFWTLYDFETVPTSVVGRLPWRKQRQKYYGCLDTEGKPKPSYQYLVLDQD
ncbi:MAG: cellulase family glycosylhydrolase [Saonia sp.]